MLAEINLTVPISMLFYIPITIFLLTFFVSFVGVPVLTAVMKKFNCYKENLLLGLNFCSQVVLVLSLLAVTVVTTLWIIGLVLILISQIPIFG